jgi:hypothetical protein
MMLPPSSGNGYDYETDPGERGKMMMDMKMMGNTLQKIVFDGKDGYAEGQGKKCL